MLEQFFIRCIIYFSKSCWLFWDRAQNMLIFGRRCSTPLKENGLSGVARGARGDCPPGRNSAPNSCPPNEITLCTEVYGEPPFWVPVSPPPGALSPRCCPLILKSLATALRMVVIKTKLQQTLSSLLFSYYILVIRIVHGLLQVSKNTGIWEHERNITTSCMFVNIG